MALVLMLAMMASLPSARANGTRDNSIAINQVGYLPAARKLAVVVLANEGGFVVEDAATGQAAYSGRLGAAAEWEPADVRVRIADFSALAQPGRYRLRIDGLLPSDEFVIADNAYAGLTAAAVKAYYFNRAGVALETRQAGRYARAAGHPDDTVLVHASAAS
ncbi:MAG: cellulase N-terminal Ig-like domain-containing protein, partial [Pseudoxanthomonas sp.]